MASSGFTSMVSVTWEEVPLSERNGIIVMYQVRLQSDDRLDEFASISDVTTAVVMELEGGILYNISVRAFTSVGPGPYSSPPAMAMTEQGSTSRRSFIKALPCIHRLSIFPFTLSQFLRLFLLHLKFPVIL